MSNAWGYPVVQTDLAGLWLTDGYVSIVDGSGTPSYSVVPSGIVRSVVRNGIGNYSIILQEAWYSLPFGSVVTVVPAGTFRMAQVTSFTIGNAAVLPIQAGGVGQSLTFQVLDAAGSAAELPLGSGFLFSLHLKQSSA